MMVYAACVDPSTSAAIDMIIIFIMTNIVVVLLTKYHIILINKEQAKIYELAGLPLLIIRFKAWQ